MRLGVPFIAPSQLEAVGDQLGRQFLPFVEWRTGQFGAPLDSHCSSPVLDFLPYRAHPTVGPPGQLAHRTVRCAQPTVGAGHVSRVDRADDRWSQAPLTHQTIRCTTGQSVNYSHVAFSFPESDEFVADVSPDSPVHHRTVRWFIAASLRCFPRAAGSPSTSLGHRTLFGASPDTVRCTTGQSGEPGPSWCWLYTANSFPMTFFFTWQCFYHLDKHVSTQKQFTKSRNIPCPMICTSCSFST
jgi:hypothetical protein